MNELRWKTQYPVKSASQCNRAGQKRLADDNVRAATTHEVKDLRRELRKLKEVVAEQALELQFFKEA